jgi:hypothetical protein
MIDYQPKDPHNPMSHRRTDWFGVVVDVLVILGMLAWVPLLWMWATVLSV